MSKTTNIQWCDATFSPWRGCSKVSEGCKNCYIYGTAPLRIAGQVSGSPRIRASAAAWRQILRWNKRPFGFEPTRRRIFPSLCDIFDTEVETAWRLDFLHLIYCTPNLDWLILTKRPEKAMVLMAECLVAYIDHEKYGFEFADWLQSWLNGRPPKNLWLGVSAENQAMADKRIPALLKIPAKVRFVSAEPLLGPIDFRFSAFNEIDWVITGGESGPRARACNVEWIRDGLRQCKAAGVAAFVKQLGANATHYLGDKRIDHIFEITEEMQNIPVKVHDKKGGDMAEWPEDLRVREFPKPRQSG